MKPFSSMLYDSMVFASCKILPGKYVSGQSRRSHGRFGRTRVDELLLRNIPALLCVDLGFEAANLAEQVSGRAAQKVWKWVMYVPFPMGQLR